MELVPALGFLPVFFLMAAAAAFIGARTATIVLRAICHCGFAVGTCGHCKSAPKP